MVERDVMVTKMGTKKQLIVCVIIFQVTKVMGQLDDTTALATETNNPNVVRYLIDCVRPSDQEAQPSDTLGTVQEAPKDSPTFKKPSLPTPKIPTLEEVKAMGENIPKIDLRPVLKKIPKLLRSALKESETDPKDNLPEPSNLNRNVENNEARPALNLKDALKGLPSLLRNSLNSDVLSSRSPRLPNGNNPNVEGLEKISPNVRPSLKDLSSSLRRAVMTGKDQDGAGSAVENLEIAPLTTTNEDGAVIEDSPSKLDSLRDKLKLRKIPSLPSLFRNSLNNGDQDGAASAVANAEIPPVITTTAKEDSAFLEDTPSKLESLREKLKLKKIPSLLRKSLSGGDQDGVASNIENAETILPVTTSGKDDAVTSKLDSLRDKLKLKSIPSLFKSSLSNERDQDVEASAVDNKEAVLPVTTTMGKEDVIFLEDTPSNLESLRDKLKLKRIPALFRMPLNKGDQDGAASAVDNTRTILPATTTTKEDEAVQEDIPNKLESLREKLRLKKIPSLFRNPFNNEDQNGAASTVEKSEGEPTIMTTVDEDEKVPKVTPSKLESLREKLKLKKIPSLFKSLRDSGDQESAAAIQNSEVVLPASTTINQGVLSDDGNTATNLPSTIQDQSAAPQNNRNTLLQDEFTAPKNIGKLPKYQPRTIIAPLNTNDQLVAPSSLFNSFVPGNPLLGDGKPAIVLEPPKVAVNLPGRPIGRITDFVRNSLQAISPPLLPPTLRSDDPEVAEDSPRSSATLFPILGNSPLNVPLAFGQDMLQKFQNNLKRNNKNSENNIDIQNTPVVDDNSFFKPENSPKPVLNLFSRNKQNSLLNRPSLLRKVDQNAPEFPSLTDNADMMPAQDSPRPAINLLPKKSFESLFRKSSLLGKDLLNNDRNIPDLPSLSDPSDPISAQDSPKPAFSLLARKNLPSPFRKSSLLKKDALLNGQNSPFSLENNEPDAAQDSPKPALNLLPIKSLGSLLKKPSLLEKDPSENARSSLNNDPIVAQDSPKPAFSLLPRSNISSLPKRPSLLLDGTLKKQESLKDPSVAESSGRSALSLPPFNRLSALSKQPVVEETVRSSNFEPVLQPSFLIDDLIKTPLEKKLNLQLPKISKDSLLRSASALKENLKASPLLSKMSKFSNVGQKSPLDAMARQASSASNIAEQKVMPPGVIRVSHEEMLEKGCDVCSSLLKAFPEKVDNGKFIMGRSNNIVGMNEPSKLIPSKVPSKLLESLRSRLSDQSAMGDTHNPIFALKGLKNRAVGDQEAASSQGSEVTSNNDSSDGSFIPRFSASKNDEPVLSAADRAKQVEEGIQKLMEFVNIVDEVDRFISDKTRHVITRLSKIYEYDMQQEQALH